MSYKVVDEVGIDFGLCKAVIQHHEIIYDLVFIGRPYHRPILVAGKLQVLAKNRRIIPECDDIFQRRLNELLGFIESHLQRLHELVVTCGLLAVHVLRELLVLDHAPC